MSLPKFLFLAEHDVIKFCTQVYIMILNKAKVMNSQIRVIASVFYIFDEVALTKQVIAAPPLSNQFQIF